MRLAKSGRGFRGLILVCVGAFLSAPLARAQGAAGRRGAAARLEHLVEANVLTDYLRARTRSKSDEAGLRSGGSLYQTILEVERGR
jgi:hypothetical protein